MLVNILLYIILNEFSIPRVLELILLTELAILQRLLRQLRRDHAHAQIVPTPYQPNVRFYETVHGRCVTISAVSNGRFYAVGVKDDFMIGIILSTNGRLYPFVDCPGIIPPSDVPRLHHCTKVKVNIYHNDEIIPITKEEYDSFRFFDVFDLSGHNTIHKAELI